MRETQLLDTDLWFWLRIVRRWLRANDLSGHSVVHTLTETHVCYLHGFPCGRWTTLVFDRRGALLAVHPDTPPLSESWRFKAQQRRHS